MVDDSYFPLELLFNGSKIIIKMKQLIILIIEFILIIGIVAGIYLANLTKKQNLPYIYQEPVIATRLGLSDTGLREELNFFLTKELGLSGGEFVIIDAVFLSTQELSGADYILITLKAYDGRLFQITVSRNSFPGHAGSWTAKLLT